MAHRGERFMKCPGCAKRGIWLRMSGECDVYLCRYCDWYGYPDALDGIDGAIMDRLKAANPSEWGEGVSSGR